MRRSIVVGVSCLVVMGAGLFVGSCGGSSAADPCAPAPKKCSADPTPTATEEGAATQLCRDLLAGGCATQAKAALACAAAKQKCDANKKTDTTALLLGCKTEQAALNACLSSHVDGGGDGATSMDGGTDGAAEASTDGATEAGSDGNAEAGTDGAGEARTDGAADVPSDTAAPADAADAPADAPAAEVDPACMTIAKDATRTVHLRITADNECDVFVNGADVGKTTDWQSPVALDVSLFVHPGRINVIAVMARNTSSQDGNDRGIIGELDDLSDGGSKVVIVTDKTWRSSKVERSGWPATLYDDSGWEPATEVASHGDGPWGGLLGTSAAKWLWSAPIPVSTADKPDAETAFFRKTFYFGTDGTTIQDKPACPAP
jgi:hypothetical protein